MVISLKDVKEPKDIETLLKSHPAETKLIFSDFDQLSKDLKESLFEHLEKNAVCREISFDPPLSLNADNNLYLKKAKAIVARNNLLQLNKKNNYYAGTISLETDNLWEVAVKIWLAIAPYKVNYFRGNKEVVDLLDQMKEIFPKKILEYFSGMDKENFPFADCDLSAIYQEQKPTRPVIVRNEINLIEQMQLIIKNGQHLPFQTIKLGGVITRENYHGVFKFFKENLIPYLVKHPIKTLNFAITIDYTKDGKTDDLDFFRNVLKEMESLTSFIQTSELTTELDFSRLERAFYDYANFGLGYFGGVASQDTRNANHVNFVNQTDAINKALLRNRRLANERKRADKKPASSAVTKKPPSEDKLKQKNAELKKESKEKKGGKIRDRYNSDKILSQLQTHVQQQKSKQQQQQQQQQQQAQLQEQHQQQVQQEVHLVEETKIPITRLYDEKKYVEQYAAKGQLDNISKYQNRWRDLVGHLNKGIDKDHRIQYLTEDAVKMLNLFPHIFKYGLNLDNLPKGFFLQRNNQGLILAYDQYRQTHKINNPLTPVCLVRPTWRGIDTYQRGNDDGRDEKSARRLGYVHLKESKEMNIDDFYDAIVEAITGKEPKKNSGQTRQTDPGLKEINDFINSYKHIFEQFSEYKSCCGFLNVLEEEGLSGLQALLQKLDNLYKIRPATLQAFKAAFMSTDVREWVSYTTNDRWVEAVDKICKLNPDERVWWEAFSQQHAKHAKESIHESSRADLVDLFAGFEYFLKEYKKLTLERIGRELPLPFEFPFHDVANMKVAMDRLLTILRNATHLQDQIDALPGMELTGDGVYYASRYQNARLVSQDMAFTQDEKNDYRVFVVPLTLKNLSGDFDRDLWKNKHNSYLITPIGVYFVDDKENLYLLENSQESMQLVKDLSTQSLMEAMDRKRLQWQYSDTTELFAEIKLDTTSISTLNKFITSKKMTYVKPKTDTRLVFQPQVPAQTSLLAPQIRPSPTYKSISVHFRIALNKTLISYSEAKILFMRNLSTKTYRSLIKEYKQALQLLDALQVDEQSQKKMLWLLSITTMSDSHPRLVNFEISQDFKLLCSLIAKNESPSTLIANLLDFPPPSSVVTLQEMVGVAYALLDKAKLPLLKKLADQHKETFLVALVNFYHNPKHISIDAFLNYLDINDVKAIPTEHLAFLLSFVNSDAFDDPKLQTFIESLNAKNDTTRSRIWNILKNIDVKKSKTFPAISELSQMINSIQDGASYGEIESQIKQTLKGCEFIQPTRSSPAVDIGSIIRDIEIALREAFEISEDDFRKLGIEYLLSIPDDKLKLCEVAIKTNLSKLMTYSIQSVLKESKLDQNVKKVLISLFENNFNVAENSNIKVFVSNAIAYVEATKKVLAVFEQLRKNLSPLAIENFVKKLSSTNSLGKAQWHLSFFTDLVSTLSKLHSFPTDGIVSIFNHKNIAELIEAKQKNFIEQVASIFSLPHLSTEDQQLLIKMAFDEAEKKTDSKTVLVESLCQLLKENPKINNLIALYAKFDKKTDIDKSVSLSQHVIQQINQLSRAILQKNPNLANHFFKIFIGKTDLFLTIPQDIKTEAIVILAEAYKTYTEADAKEFDIAGLIEQNNLLQKLNALSPEQLVALQNIYLSHRPPKLEVLAEWLKTPDKLNETILDYQKNPYRQARENDFNISNIVPQIVSMIDDSQGERRPLQVSESKDLHKWMLFINAIGHSHPIKRTEDGKLGPAIKNLTNEEMKAEIGYCLEIFGDSGATETVRLQARLTFLALAREAMFRATGQMPNSTQILCVLNAIQTGDQNLLAEIATGQGKTMIAALYATMLWFEGGSVNICTSDADVAKRDLEKNIPFFEFMGIPYGAKPITESSALEDYVDGGIHYSDAAQLSLFITQNQKHSKVLNKKMHLVLDEADFTILDDSTLYRAAIALEGSQDAVISPDAWIYRALMDYIETEGETNGKAIRKFLLDNITKYAEPHLNKDSLKVNLQKKTDEKLEQWLNSAVAASFLTENKDFVVRQEKGPDIETPEISVAKLLIAHNVADRSEWSYGVQQCLHARLEKERLAKLKKDKKEDKDGKALPNSSPFLITPERAALSSMSSKNFIDFFRKQGGKVHAMTGSAFGSETERRELTQKYGFAIRKMPRHEGLQRKDRAKIVDDVKVEAKNQIKAKLEIKPVQPIVIVCNGIEKAEEIYQYLLKEFPDLKKDMQLYHANGCQVGGSPVTRSYAEVVKYAGVAGSITICTEKLARAADFVPRLQYGDTDQTHPKGLLVMTTFMPGSMDKPKDAENISDSPSRNAIQALGRAGRKGHKGETLMIVGRSEKENITALREKEDKVVQDRSFREKQSDIIDCVYNEFLKLYAKVPEELQNDFEKRWVQLLERMEKDWLNTIEQYPNDLDQCENIFVEMVCERWKSIIVSYFDNMEGYKIEGGLLLTKFLVQARLQELQPEKELMQSVLAERSEKRQAIYALDVSEDEAFVEFALDIRLVAPYQLKSADAKLRNILADLMKNPSLQALREEEKFMWKTPKEKAAMVLPKLLKRINVSKDPVEVNFLRYCYEQIIKIAREISDSKGKEMVEQLDEEETENVIKLLETADLEQKNSLNFLKESLLAEFKPYQKQWKALDRRSNLKTLLQNLNQAKGAPALHTALNLAISNLIREDSKKRLFFKRNIEGSRYLDILVKAKNHLLIHAKDQDIYQEEINFLRKISQTGLNIPKEIKPQIQSLKEGKLDVGSYQKLMDLYHTANSTKDTPKIILGTLNNLVKLAHSGKVYTKDNFLEPQDHYMFMINQAIMLGPSHANPHIRSKDAIRFEGTKANFFIHNIPGNHCLTKILAQLRNEIINAALTIHQLRAELDCKNSPYNLSVSIVTSDNNPLNKSIITAKLAIDPQAQTITCQELPKIQDYHSKERASAISEDVKIEKIEAKEPVLKMK